MLRREEELPKGWKRVKRKLWEIATVLPAVAKIGAMGAERVFSATRADAWVFHAKDGLSNIYGMITATAFATFAILDNSFGRGFSMVRRARAEALHPEIVRKNPYHAATWTYPGVETGILTRIGYTTIQTSSVLYMLNSIPGSYLNALAISKLAARLSGTTFNSYCNALEDTNPQSSLAAISMAHFIGTFLAYSTISSFLSYNTPNIRLYYNKLFVEGMISDVSLWSWLETFSGNLINTLGIAYSSFYAWQSLEDETFCHLGIENIPETFIKLWILQACINNILMNGMMTLMAVHLHNTQHNQKESTKLTKEIELPFEIDSILRASIYGNAFAAFCATEVQVANLPGLINKNYTDLAYNPYLILAALPLAKISFSNQLALSMESFNRELLKRKEEKDHAVALIDEQELITFEPGLYIDTEHSDYNTRSLLDFSDKASQNYGTYTYDLANGNGHRTHQPKQPRQSLCNRLLFFKSSAEVSAFSEDEELLETIQDDSRRSLRGGSSRGCSIM